MHYTGSGERFQVGQETEEEWVLSDQDPAESEIWIEADGNPTAIKMSGIYESKLKSKKRNSYPKQIDLALVPIIIQVPMK